MSIIELTTLTEVYGQACINRYHYMSPSNGTPFGGFAIEFVNDWRAAMETAFLAMLTNTAAVRYQEVRARSLYDSTDFAENLSLNLPGGHSGGESLASNWCFSLRSNRMEAGRNRSYKRVSGFGELDIVGNDPAAAELTRINAYAALLIVPVIVDNGIDPSVAMSPVVLKLEKTIDPETLKASYAPYLSETAQRAQVMVPTGYQFYQMTSQNSRRPGRGI